MLGLHFSNCNEFGLSISFDHCNLSHASFFRTKMKNTTFQHSRLHEVDFSDCDLTLSVFDACDLAHAKFENSILEKVDFRTAINYFFDPEINRIKKARFSSLGVAGLLRKYDIEID
jgi:uncharacterized protein YjbI with pentapeptide repeats